MQGGVTQLLQGMKGVWEGVEMKKFNNIMVV